jgi:MoxR-like ATPase
METSFEPLLTQANKIILGKEKVVKLLLTSLLADGHVLLEDVPGVGKTTLVKFLAQSLGAQFNRVQCTSDLLPSDILGVTIFDRDRSEFQVKKGPIFSQLLLVDELNRATPKTQSALLQAMEERFVSLDGEHYPLPKPFIVMATQNPRDQIGTYPLPESQLDRFLLKIEVGFPSEADEIQLLKGEAQDLESQKETLLPLETIMNDRARMPEIHLSDYLYRYLLSLIQTTRQQSIFRPLSPRAGIDMVSSLKAWCVVNDEKEVLPDHVQALAPYVWAHRLSPQEFITRAEELSLCDHLLSMVPVP